MDYLSTYLWEKMMWHRRKTQHIPNVGQTCLRSSIMWWAFLFKVIIESSGWLLHIWRHPAVGGVVHSTYRATCEKLGIIGDDFEWWITLQEATVNFERVASSFFTHVTILWCIKLAEIMARSHGISWETTSALNLLHQILNNNTYWF